MKKKLHQAGPVTRSPKQQAIYLAHLDKVNGMGCSFCDRTIPDAPQPIETFTHFYTAHNVYGYDIWDGCTVTEHLMLIPLKHVATLGELSKNAQHEFAQIIADFETKGYSFYGRSPDNITKSVTHQHTHLIKLESRRRKFLLYLRTPHVLLSR